MICITYENQKVKELFEDLNDIRNSKNLMKKAIGTEITRAVKKRYNQIIAFDNFYELIQSYSGKIESLAGNKDGEYSLWLTANYILIIAPNTKTYNTETLKRCDTCIIKGVVDYHGKGSKNNWLIP